MVAGSRRAASDRRSWRGPSCFGGRPRLRRCWSGRGRCTRVYAPDVPRPGIGRSGAPAHPAGTGFSLGAPTPGGYRRAHGPTDRLASRRRRAPARPRGHRDPHRRAARPAGEPRRDRRSGAAQRGAGQPHRPPDDTEFLELYGTPGASLAGLSLLVVEGDSSGEPGTVDRRLDFAPTRGWAATASSWWATRPASRRITRSCRTWRSAMTGSRTAARRSRWRRPAAWGARARSLTGGEVVLDAVGLADTGATDAWFFGAPVVGPDDGFLAAGARRLVDGVDTDSAADWVIADDLLGPANTPTAATPFNAPPAADCGMPLTTQAGIAAAAGGECHRSRWPRHRLRPGRRPRSRHGDAWLAGPGNRARWDRHGAGRSGLHHTRGQLRGRSHRLDR